MPASPWCLRRIFLLDHVKCRRSRSGHETAFDSKVRRAKNRIFRRQQLS